ncbi:MAG: hypothetical protein Q9227_001721 [Pyrenula ochraceoflavens]
MSDDNATVKAVKSEKPKLLHSPSKQSLAVTTDEQSSSEHSTNSPSDKTQITAIRHESPPSKETTPPSEKELSQMSSISRPPPTAKSHYSNIHKPRAVPSEDDRITPGIDDTPFIRFGLNQLTIDEEITGHGRYSSVDGDFDVERGIHDSGLGYNRPTSLTGDRRPPPRRHSRVQDKRPVTRRHKAPVFVAADPPKGQKHPHLDYMPYVLRPLPLLLFIFACLLMMAALIFCNVQSSQHNGLWDYDGVGGGRYFVFQYLPQMIGVLILLWLYGIQSSLYRCMPFLFLGTRRPSETALQDVSMLPKNFVLPDLSHFRRGKPLFGLCILVFWVMNFTIPLLAAAFQTKVLNVDGRGTWRWTAVEGVNWTLMVLYILLILTITLLLVLLRRYHTGLIWDPVSCADLIPIFQKSNLISDYWQSEVRPSLQLHIPPRKLRLGYWTLSNSNSPFYAIAEENSPQTRSSFEAGTTIEKTSPKSAIVPETQRQSRPESYLRDLHSPFVRYRWAPWFLRDSAVVAWSVAAVVLLVAFIVVSFVHNAVRDGFDPRLSTAPNSSAFSPSNFFYSFLPALLGMFLVLAWHPIDIYFRAVEPFANLAWQQGASARRSLLLRYSSLPPFLATFAALRNHHYKVAITSFISLLSFTIPILAGGVFSALTFPSPSDSHHSVIRIVAHMPGYVALTVFLAIYVIAMLTSIWPTRRRYLPHGIYTLADILSFMYQSPLLTEQGMRGLKSRRDLAERLEGGRGREQKYVFGLFLGRDGKEHLGIDRVENEVERERTGSGEGLMGR